MIYLLVAISLLLLSFRYDINGKERYKDVCYYSILVILILIAGLRYRLGIDTPNYIYAYYHTYPSFEVFSWEDYPIGEDPLYVLINSIVKSLGGRFYVVQLIQSAFVNILIFKYFKKHTQYVFTCIFLYFTLYCYTEFNMEIMRGSMSIAICLFANDYILERKWIKGYLLYFIACLLHVQTIVILAMPILFFLKLNKKGIVFLVLAFIAGRVLQAALTNYLSLMEVIDMDSSISGKASSYAESDKYGTQAGNINFMIVHILPWLVYSFASIVYIKRYNPNNGILKLEPFVLIGIVFLLIQINIQIAYRFVDYYKLFFLLFYTETFISIVKRNKHIALSISYTRAFVVFLPLFMLVGYLYILRGYQYFPYSSVIERSVDQDRESQYVTAERPRANINEY